MKKNFSHFKKNSSDSTNNSFKKKVNKKEPFFPYQDKVKVAYFSYAGLFCFLGLLVYIFSLFLIINLVNNGKFHLTKNLNDINFFFTPIVILILVTISWFLLLFAPRKVYKSPKHSSVMFYFSFWFLVFSVLLNAQLQLTYIKVYSNDIFYNWLNVIFAKVVIIFSVFALFGVQIFFWLMRRKFAFMPTDYEIYLEKANNKKEKKLLKDIIN